MEIPEQLIDVMKAAQHVMVLTGAGISAESGLATFRDPLTGLWQRFNPEELATPRAFERDPALVWGWCVSYDLRGTAGVVLPALVRRM
jgi:NAD-dependent deacetylase